MKIKKLDNFIFFITAGCALLLSVLFSVAVYFLALNQAEKDSVTLSNNLIKTVNASASAAAFSGNEAVAKDVIDGLLSNEIIYSVQFTAFADEVSDGFTLSATTSRYGQGMQAITLQLYSPFDDQVIGELVVQPNTDWVEDEAEETAVFWAWISASVIFCASLVAAQVIRILVSRPIVRAVKQLRSIELGEDTRIHIPAHLRNNEIGALIDSFNVLLSSLNQAIQLERTLRTDMEEVQERLEQARLQAEQATMAKSNFLATMSHEIRTPMNSIIGFIELALESSNLDVETRKHLGIASQSARYLMQLINDILDVSKIESGKLELEQSPFDLADLLDEVKDLMEIKAREKGLTLLVRKPDVFPHAYRGDHFRLRQVLINLLGNAIKFTKQGRVGIAVDLFEDNRVNFSVTDTGIGIAEDKIQLILSPFTQVDASITREFGGSGLGTTISAELISLMGGELQIDSVKNKGSRFHFSIPLEPCESAKSEERVEHDALQPVKGLSILVVDDVKENVKLSKLRLEKHGHSVTPAFNGQEAVTQVREGAFDVVLMDINMPVMNGYEATRAIRQLAAPTCDLPIIAMTANALEEEKNAILAAGVDDVVTKPVDFNRLFSLLANLKTDKATQATSVNNGGTKKRAAFVNFDSGLEIWQNEGIYYRGLKNFAKQNEQLENKINALCARTDHEELLNELHKLKGSAANFACEKIAQCCELLELNISKSEGACDPDCLRSLQISIRETLDIISRLPTSSNSDPDETPFIVDDMEINQEQLEQLKTACQKYDPDMAESALKQLANSLSEPTLLELRTAIDSFDFSTAISVINDLQLSLEKEV